MIAKVITGKSFRGVLNYCLHDKQELSREDKVLLEKLDGLKHEHRAEVLDYNMCYGDKKELLKQFEDVRNTRPQLGKPVFHATISMDPGDRMTTGEMRNIARDFASEFGIENNQFITVLHHDTQHKHVHIIANRVRFDGKTISDSHSYKKAVEACRKLEEKYKLKQVLSPRKYLPQHQRDMPREDQRKELMKEQIRQTLSTAKDFEDFCRLMKQKKIEVIKSRGISFQDNKKVYVKGSELNYPLRKIEKILEEPLERRQQLKQDKVEEELKPHRQHHRHRLG